MSYNKYGVPDDNGNMSSAIMPKLSYRFKVVFIGLGSPSLGGSGISQLELTKNVVDVNLPNFQQEAIQIDSYVSRYYVQGKHTWSSASLNLRNDFEGNVAKLLQSQQDQQYNAYHQSHAAASGRNKFQIKILLLDGENREGESPNILEGWHLTGCWLEDLNWGQGQYSSGEPLQIATTVRFDNAFHYFEISGNNGSFADSTAIQTSLYGTMNNPDTTSAA